MWTEMTTPENVKEVHRQLFAGTRPGQIANQVQGMNPPMFPGRSVHDVTGWFNSYHKKFVLPEQQRALMEAAKYSGSTAIRKRLDLIAELEDLVVTHRERFNKGLKTEAQSPVPMDAVTKLAMAYGDAMERLAKLYLETGLMVRVPKKVTGTLKDLMGTRAVFEFTEEEAARFREDRLLEGIGYEREDDGEQRPV
jgi:hypothetical protein